MTRGRGVHSLDDVIKKKIISCHYSKVHCFSKTFFSAHVRESQYVLQLVRCNDHQCCTPWRSPLQNLLPCRFLPNPVPAKHSGQSIVTSNADNAPTFLSLFVNLQLNSMVQKEKMGEFIIPPYDLYCPSVMYWYWYS